MNCFLEMFSDDLLYICPIVNEKHFRHIAYTGAKP